MAATAETGVRARDPHEHNGCGADDYDDMLPRAVRALSHDDQELWRKAYEEARARGAGSNVARFFANQRLEHVREKRHEIVVPGTRDYAAYR